MPSLIGVLMLIGIVVTNAIVLVDLIDQYREGGLSVADAVVLGASRRLRPVLMTAFATIFALLPMATLYTAVEQRRQQRRDRRAGMAVDPAPDGDDRTGGGEADPELQPAGADAR